MPTVYITKADGEQEPFDPNKLTGSLERAGASSGMRSQIVERVMREMKDGMTTNEIYRRAFDLLREKEKKPVAARYSVKRAVLDLGPSGFPFEQLVAELMRADGWSARTGVATQGKCAPHEVDIVAEKDGKRIGIEAKFHNAAGIKTDLKDALYIHARFEDLKNAPEEQYKMDEGWLMTNTRLTRNAIRYGKCTGLKMFGWDYPRGEGVLSMIERAGVHPLTCLTTLREGEKKRFLEKDIVLCRSIVKGRHLLEEYGVAPQRIDDVLEEARQLCTSHSG